MKSSLGEIRKNLKEIRQRRYALVEAIASCSNECVQLPPGLWCQKCQIARAQEATLAWTCNDTSLVDDAIAKIVEMRKAHSLETRPDHSDLSRPISSTGDKE